jgi:hypothetical protein
LQNFVKRHPRVQLIQSDGNPPERYQVQYEIRSLRQKDGRLIIVDNHLVEIALPLNYPRMPPQCRMLTPIFHPNIAPHAICIGDHWSPGETLSSIVARIGELIAYQSYNVKSPLNGEAARWTSENLDQLPLDPVSMLVEETGPAPRPAEEPWYRSPAPATAPSGVRSQKSEVRNQKSEVRSEQPGSAAAPTPHPSPTNEEPWYRSPAPASGPSPARSQESAVGGEHLPLTTPHSPTPNAITFACSECQSPLRVPVNLAGKRARCPRCKSVNTVPVKDSSS